MRTSRSWGTEVFLCLVFSLLVTGAATAAEPDPQQSTWSPQLGRSPKNLEVGPEFQYMARGVLRDAQGVPVAHFPAELIALDILPACGNPVVLHPDADSNAEGIVVWGAAKFDQGGGACAGDLEAAIRITGLGVFKIYHLIMSPDGNGDGLIGLPDLGTFQHSFVTQTNPQFGDLNLDEEIGLRDLGFFQHHFTAP
jgi:hypothetical protein